MLATLNFWLWAAQALLAALYAAAGMMKTFMPIPRLATNMGWVNDYAAGLVRFVGIAEIAGAAGLILPMVTGILPWLTPLAAAGLGLIQLLAMPVHARRGETAVLPVNLILLALSLFIVWGRFDLFSA